MLKSSDVIKLTKVKFSYPSGTIFDNLSVGFSKAKVTAVMGGSGSGKTTILKLIGGQIRPNYGEVSYGGENINQFSYDQLFRFRRKLGMLFQFGALFTDLNVFDNVAFPLREQSLLPEVAIRDLVLLKLHTVGLRGASKLMPFELSGGMARRVALARAIALDPEVMLYDEPFTGLDPISTAITGDLIRRLNNALGITSIFVTHDIKASFKVADEVVLLSRGQVTARGTPQELIASRDPFVRQFVGGEVDGPVPFHVSSENIAKDLGIPNSHWLKK